MENRKFVKFLAPAVLLGAFLIPQSIFAYGIDTHVALTGAIFEYYNNNFSENKISDEFKDYLIDGSRHEDAVPRWLNHFYDPVYDRGLESIYGNGYKSKDWAVNSEMQNGAKYKLTTAFASILSAIQQKSLGELTAETEFTWQRAIRFYVNGEKEKAMYALGHILHLIEDASVPDHTRNDPHPGGLDGSPYEEYTSQEVIYSANLLANAGVKKPVILSDLSEYFDKIANYSNNNFYSRDTIGVQSGYKSPTPYEFEREGYFMYAISKADEDKIRLYKQEISNSIILKINDEILFDRDDIMDGYWRLLSTQSIRYGAGVINLFFQEVEKAKNDPTFAKEETKSFFARVVEAVKNLFSNDDDAVTVKEIQLSEEELAQRTEEVAGELKQETPDATVEEVAKKVVEQIVKETAEETTSVSDKTEIGQEQPETIFPININTATLEGLQKITGIGPTLAQRIIDYRNTIGTFYYIEEIKNVSGIGDATFEKMKDQITVGNVTPPSSSGSSSQNNASQQTNNDSNQQDNNEQEQNQTEIPSLEIISVIFDPDGVDDGNERIVIKNTGSNEADISSYSIQYLSSTANNDFSKIAKKNFESGNKISADSTFTIGVNCHTATPCEDVDMSWSQALGNSGGSIFVVLNQEKITDASDPDILDSFDYGGSSASAVYDPGAIVINLSWDDLGAENAYYAVYTVNSPAVLFATTTETTFTYSIDEIGRDYNFEIRAVDDFGNETATTSAQISVPSFLDGVYFFKDPRVIEDKYLIDLRWESYPFMPNPFNNGDATYKVLVFYLNQDADKIPLFYSDLQYSLLSDDDIVKSYGEWGSRVGLANLILKDSYDICPANNCGGIRNGAYDFFKMTANNLLFNISTSSFLTAPTTDDFITASFYAYNGFNRQDLVAADKTKYFFTEDLSHQIAPEMQDELNLGLDGMENTFSVGWSAADDPDTLVASLAYQINFTPATNGKLDEELWEDIGSSFSRTINVSAEDDFLIGVRAVDDFGNTSEPLVEQWNFPEDFNLSDYGAILGGVAWVWRDRDGIIYFSSPLEYDGETIMIDKVKVNAKTLQNTPNNCNLRKYKIEIFDENDVVVASKEGDSRLCDKTKIYSDIIDFSDAPFEIRDGFKIQFNNAGSMLSGSEYDFSDVKLYRVQN